MSSTTPRGRWTSRRSVGRAVSKAPGGPFVDSAARPLVCQKQLGGSIDPDIFRAGDGRLYLYWKNDGNCCGRPTAIYGQRLSADGLRLVGRRAHLELNDAGWEGTTVEAPTMWRHAGRYVLLYSANVYDSADYAVGYARCAGPLGPCVDAAENPILRSACRAVGPGHQALVVGPGGRTWIVYHAWSPGKIGAVAPGRQLWIDRLEWAGPARPRVAGPTCSWQPEP